MNFHLSTSRFLYRSIDSFLGIFVCVDDCQEIGLGDVRVVNWFEEWDGSLARGNCEFVGVDVPLFHEGFGFTWFCAAKEGYLQRDVGYFFEFAESEIECGVKERADLFHAFLVVRTRNECFVDIEQRRVRDRIHVLLYVRRFKWEHPCHRRRVVRMGLAESSNQHENLRRYLLHRNIFV